MGKQQHLMQWRDPSLKIFDIKTYSMWEVSKKFQRSFKDFDYLGKISTWTFEAQTHKDSWENWEAEKKVMIGRGSKHATEKKCVLKLD